MAFPLLILLATATAGAHLGELARRDAGDVFTLVYKCDPTQCLQHDASSTGGKNVCECTCPQNAPLFREDLELCVNDLPECSLATFGTDPGSQRVPFVFLPLKGQIIHPSKEIVFADVKTPICAVSGAQFLTRKGFVDIRNTLDADVPFSLFRDEGRTFLQWSGDDELRSRMSGRVMVVRLLCRDVTATPMSPLDLRGVFTPCVAFRVQGSPPKPITNITEVQFASNAHTSDAVTTTGLSVTEYVAIGISSLLLGLIYVASVFLYLHIRKGRKIASAERNSRTSHELKKDGVLKPDRDIIRISNERIQSLPNSIGQDDGVVKRNPLLSMGHHFHDVRNNFTSDSGSTLSDSEDLTDGSLYPESVSLRDKTTAVIVHSNKGETKLRNENVEQSQRDESGIERLPDEHVSIVETTDDREIARPVGTTRRKLYFNPAYFEPRLMADPPPAALEFLVKIREVISVAKQKMATKRFQPILNEIPEEETFSSNGNSIDFYQGIGSQKSGSGISLKRENSRKKTSCIGCPGCVSETINLSDSNNFTKHKRIACINCHNSQGEKQNNVRKWLENIHVNKDHNEYNCPSNVEKDIKTTTRYTLKRQNSLTNCYAKHESNDIFESKKISTMSVKSEPSIRNYNIPLSDFGNIRSQYDNCFFETITPATDITPIGLNHNNSNRFKSKNIMNNHTKLSKNNNLLPDMINEAIAVDNISISLNQNSSDDEISHNTNLKSTSKNKSESPTGNDYEIDSLERVTIKKNPLQLEYTDVSSSQPSPSLSNALPLEEELTMRNAVYKTHSSSNSNTPSPHGEILTQLNHYETIGSTNKKIKTKPKIINDKSDYSLVSEVYVNNSYDFESNPTSPSGSECSLGSRKVFKSVSIEKPGCLTIEVKDPPENYIKIHESDGFEPDTLDRKQKSKENSDFVPENKYFSRKDLLKTIEKEEKCPTQSIMLRSSGTFQKSLEINREFHKLRNEYDEKPLQQNNEDKWKDPADWSADDGRVLTLELRHSKRQRQCTSQLAKQYKKLDRPDILPPLPPTSESHNYEKSNCCPKKEIQNDYSSIESNSKNVEDRSLGPRHLLNFPEDKIYRVTHDSHNGLACSPKRASVVIQSDCENVYIQESKKKVNELNKFVGSRRYSATNSETINTSTFTKGQNINYPLKSKLRRKKTQSIEDSGYLSSDSASSRLVPRKLFVPKIVSCSDSDDTENEARSESGAESVETHSVYFGSYRQSQICVNTATDKSKIKGARDSFKMVRKVNI